MPSATVLSIATSGQTVTVTQHLGNGESREVTLTFPATCVMAVPGCVPETMVYDGRTWSYNTTGSTLHSVQPPDGAPWQYEYGGTPELQTMKTITPHGGSVEYTIETVGFPWVDGETYFTNVVKYRDTVDVRGGESSGRWSYEYDWEAADLAKSSTIIAPDGTRTKFEFDFVGAPGSPYIGRTYLLTRRMVRQGVDEVACEDAVECETREYQEVPLPGAAIVGTTLPELSVRTIRRGAKTYTTTYGYDSANYGDYHQPNEITETGDRTRVTTRTFVHSADAPYDAPYFIGLLASETINEPDAHGSQTIASSATYDPATGFNLTQTRAGLQTSFTADAFGNIATVTKPNGKTTSYHYSWGQAREITTPEHITTRQINQDGTIASETIGGYTTTYVYDNAGRLTHLRPAGYPSLSSETITTYDNASGASVTVERGASQTVTTLDGFGRPIATTGNGIRTVTRYDPLGRPKFQGYPVDVNDPDIGATIEYNDPFGRETKRIHPGGTTSVQRTYGPDTVTVTDEEGRSTVETMAAFGAPGDARTVSLRDADGKTWTYRYNVAGQMVEAAAQDGIVRSWVYNANNLLEREVHPESGATTYAYTAGVLTTKTDADGTATTFSYDGNDRVKTATAGGVVTTVAYETGTDSRAWMSNGSVVTTFLYDAAGRLARRQDAVDGKLFNTRFEYWTDDTLKATVYPSGRRIEYQRNSAGQVTSVSEPLAGRDHAFGLMYHPSGALRGFAHGNLLQTSVTFDPQRYWVRSIASGPLQLSYDDYDDAGNVGTITHSRLGAQRFTYDALDRLTGATGWNGSIGYSYDLHGNRQTNATGSYQYQPGTLRLVDQNGTPFGYDNSGNMRTAGNATYTYTPQNMLATAAVVGGTASYAYDADLQRVKKSFAGSTTYFIRGLSGELLSEWKDPGLSSGTIRDYVHADAHLISAVEKATTQDPNATCGVIVPGAPAVMVSVASGQNPCLTFEGVANRFVSAVMTSVAPVTYSGGWSFRLRRANGTLLGSSAGACCGDKTAFLDTRILPADETYKLEIDPSSTQAGTVSVQLFDVVHASGFITANGAPVGVTLTTPGQNGYLSFNGVEGQTVSATLTTASPSGLPGLWHLRLQKDGVSLPGGGGDGYGCCGDKVVLRDAVVLPATGTYKLVIDPDKMNLGTVDIRLYDATPFNGTIAPDGQPVSVPLPRPGQNGYLKFNGTAGQTVAATLTATSPSPLSGFWYLRIRKSNGQLLPGDGYACCGDLTALRDAVVLPAPDEYTVEIDPNFTATGTVAVRLFDAATVTGTIAVNGDAVPITIARTGQNGELTFQGVEGQTVSATMRATSPGTFGGLWYLRILKPDRSPLTTGGDGYACCGDTVGLRNPVVLPSPGTYTLVVDPNFTQTGSVDVRLYQAATVTGTLTVGGDPVPLALVPGQIAELTFSGTPGQQATVRVTGNTMGLTSLKLKRPDGTTVTTGSSAANFNSATQTLAAGTYTVTVDPSNANSGSFTIAVTTP
jgi:YD repeat-containing protein